MPSIDWTNRPLYLVFTSNSRSSACIAVSPVRHRSHGEHARSAVARDPERRAPRARALVPAARQQDERKGGEERTFHLSAFERTAFVSVARTSRRCLPTQPRPAFVFTLRPSTSSRAPAAGVETPWSFCETTV